MTKLLQQAIEELKKLPAAEQDAIAKRLLAELEDERVWEASFHSTTDLRWDRLAKTVRREIAAGEITPLHNDFSFASKWPGVFS